MKFKCEACLETARMHGIEGEPCILDAGNLPVPPPDACPFSADGGTHWELIE